jgi:ribosome-binding protein aMBF1 (putative translation factor)
VHESKSESWDGRRGRGENHHFVRYSDETLCAVVAMKRAGFTTKEVSRATGVSPTQVHAVLDGRSRAYLHAAIDPTPDIHDLIAACPDLGAAIQSARSRRGWTRAALARALGVRDNAVSRWERGTRVPHPSSVRQIAEVLGLTWEQLLVDSCRSEQSADRATLSEVSGASSSG